MKIGVAGPPLFGTGPDPIAIRDFAQTVEGLGFNHYGFAERIVQNDVSKLPEFAGRPANYRGLFNEVFTLMCFLAGVTNRIELMSCILILPIRPTALVAKQAAHAQMLSGGRIRLGVAVGGSALEYEAMGVDFHTRGRRMTEQIAVLRRLWTEDSVFIQSEFHNLRYATLNPRPDPIIPIWIGSGNTNAPFPADNLLRRAARIADGFTAMSLLPPERASELTSKLRRFAAGVRPRTRKLRRRGRHHADRQDAGRLGARGALLARRRRRPPDPAHARHEHGGPAREPEDVRTRDRAGVAVPCRPNLALTLSSSIATAR